MVLGSTEIEFIGPASVIEIDYSTIQLVVIFSPFLLPAILGLAIETDHLIEPFPLVLQFHVLDLVFIDIKVDNSTLF